MEAQTATILFGGCTFEFEHDPILFELARQWDIWTKRPGGWPQPAADDLLARCFDASIRGWSGVPMEDGSVLPYSAVAAMGSAMGSGARAMGSGARSIPTSNVGYRDAGRAVSIHFHAPVYGVDDLDARIDQAGERLYSQLRLGTVV